MIKLKKEKVWILLVAIMFIAYMIYYIYDKFFESEEYIINNEFLMYGTENELNSTNKGSEIKSQNKIVIHIIGEVENEGIVHIEEGARIIDAVDAAGGLTNLADISKVNLAYELKDGQMVKIPSIENNEESIDFVLSNSGEGTIVGDTSNDSGINKININKATIEELQTLPGIGKSTAEKIINYRKENGEFFEIDDIKNVSGIGESKFNSIKDRITV